MSNYSIKQSREHHGVYGTVKCEFKEVKYLVSSPLVDPGFSIKIQQLNGDDVYALGIDGTFVNVSKYNEGPFLREYIKGNLRLVEGYKKEYLHANLNIFVNKGISDTYFTKTNKGFDRIENNTVEVIAVLLMIDGIDFYTSHQDLPRIHIETDRKLNLQRIYTVNKTF